MLILRHRTYKNPSPYWQKYRDAEARDRQRHDVFTMQGRPLIALPDEANLLVPDKHEAT